MNKLTKAAIAGAAGVILLMGGAGSLAYWNDSIASGPSGQTVTAGTLTVTAGTAGSWTKAYSATTTYLPGTAVANIGAVAVVPGNRLVYTQTFNVNATGDDLYFTVTKTDGAISAVAGTPTPPANTALALLLNTGNSTFSVSAPVGGNVVVSTPGIYKVNASAGPSVVTVTWTITLPFGAAVDNSTKTGVVALSQGSVTLTQVAGP